MLPSNVPSNASTSSLWNLQPVVAEAVIQPQLPVAGNNPEDLSPTLLFFLEFPALHDIDISSSSTIDDKLIPQHTIVLRRDAR